MEKNFDINQQGYSIRCKLLINDNDKQTRTFDNVVIVTHGFGSHKDTAGTVHLNTRRDKYKNYAVIAFDWPPHRRADACKKLSLPECMNHLDWVVDYAKTEPVQTHLQLFDEFRRLHHPALPHRKGAILPEIALRSPVRHGV